MNKISNYKKILVLVFLYHFTGESNILWISLGNACGVAGALKENNLRNVAYPFDWIVTPFDGLYGTLKNNFADFLNTKFLTIRSDGSAIINRLTGFEFVHDFPTYTSMNLTEHEAGEAGIIKKNFLDYLPLIAEKYHRRIIRLLQACQSNDKIIFIRNRDTSLLQALNLCNLLSEKYPQLDFLLVIVDDENLFFNELSPHERIKIFYGPEYIQYDKHPALINWKKIFNEIMDLL